MIGTQTQGDLEEATKRLAPVTPRMGAVRRCFTLFKVGSLRSVLLASAALAAVVYCILRIIAPPEPVPKPFYFGSSAKWITTNATTQACGSFRLDLYVPGKIVNAWIALAANGGFEVIANGDVCSRFFLLSPTQPYQKGLSQMGQKLTPAEPAISVNFPREYQWLHHDNAQLPTYIDLTSALNTGRNALCVEVEDNDTTPAFILSGEVLLDTGERIPIASGPQWKAEPVPRTKVQDAWTYVEFPVIDWSNARVLDWKRWFWRLVPEGVFQEPFRGKRIRSVMTDSVTWIEKDFESPSAPTEGFLRVATDCPFQIWMNGQPVQVTSRSPRILPYGPWFIRNNVRSPVDVTLQELPDWLDPENVDTLLPGQQRENPLRNDPTVNNYTFIQQQIDGTAAHPEIGSDPTRNAGVYRNSIVRRSNPYADPQKPDRIVSPALGRNRRNVEFLAYDITPLLRKGKNTVRVGLYKDQPETMGLSRLPFAAFDGRVRMRDDNYFSFASDESVCSYADTLADGRSRLAQSVLDGPIEPSLLPAKEFFGYVYPDRPWFALCVALFFCCSTVLLIGATRSPRLMNILGSIQTPCAVLTGWICVGLLLRSAILERSESIYWRFPVVWLALLAFGIGGALLTIALQRRRMRNEAIKPSKALIRFCVPPFNWSWLWPLAFAVLVAFCFAVRAWQIDFQPPDVDEYASLQASLAIAKTGLPEFQEGVWYTRSPAYHYLAGAVAAISNGNIYGLRLLSVLFACFTAILVWKMSKELTRSRLLACCALILYSIHPYLIFTSHEARFYQQHQFFHLLGLYFFVRGFVTNTGMRDRYLAVITMLVCVLSQEITVLQVFPLAICYLLFAKRRSWSDEARLLIVAGCSIALISLDLAFFKIQCLTALDGVSPRIEAKIGWCFQNPINLFALLVGYSRLHVLLSVFLLVGFLSALRRKQNIWTCLYIYLFVSVVVTNLLITSKAFRYEYFIIPLWIVLSVYGIGECARIFIPGLKQLSARTMLALGFFALAVCSWTPWRIFGSHDVSLEANPTQALRFVAENLRPGDQIVTMEPYPDAALLETGQSDYDLSIPILYDFAFRKRGKLVDRNTGAEIIGNLDELQRAFAQHDRLWIVCDREQLHTRGIDLQWMFPAARVRLYLRNNTRLVFRSYLWSVYLWDRNAGHYSSFREKPGNWFE